jgi:hypothetical protein
MTKIQNFKPYFISRTKVLKDEKRNQLVFLGWSVLVIDCWDLGFYCYLVLEIWEFHLAGCAL